MLGYVCISVPYNISFDTQTVSFLPLASHSVAQMASEEWGSAFPHNQPHCIVATAAWVALACSICVLNPPFACDLFHGCI
jgi:hypothetical protein